MKRTFVIFYILFAYILLSFFWWTYLMFDFNRTTYEHKQELKKIHAEGQVPQKIENKLNQEYRSRKWMIIGEGSVFFILLLIGGYMMYRSFRQEIALNRQQRNFLLSVTHELKSPLSSIQLALETLQKRTVPKEKRQELVENSVRETERLQGLVENVLTAARFEQQHEVNRQSMNFSKLLEQEIERLKKTDEADIETEIQENIHLTGDPTLLQTLIRNLLTNARKYAREGGTISVRLKEENQQAVLSVSDQGPGIPKAERQRVFERFYRVGDEQTRTTKGTGLGLYIARQVAETHHGTISIEENKPQGTRVIVKLPLS